MISPTPNVNQVIVNGAYRGMGLNQQASTGRPGWWGWHTRPTKSTNQVSTNQRKNSARTGDVKVLKHLLSLVPFFLGIREPAQNSAVMCAPKITQIWALARRVLLIGCLKVRHQKTSEIRSTSSSFSSPKLMVSSEYRAPSEWLSQAACLSSF